MLNVSTSSLNRESRHFDSTFLQQKDASYYSLRLFVHIDSNRARKIIPKKKSGRLFYKTKQDKGAGSMSKALRFALPRGKKFLSVCYTLHKNCIYKDMDEIRELNRKGKFICKTSKLTRAQRGAVLVGKYSWLLLSWV